MTIFESRPIDWRVLAHELVTGVSLQVRPESSNRVWTEAVKSVLQTLGKSKQFYVVPDRQQGEGEFLLDLVWWKNTDLNDLVLAVESEWGGPGQIWHDFGKLLVVKSPLKLMVYGTIKHDNAIRQGIEEKYMRKFTHHLSGEQYVLAEFDSPTYEVDVYATLLKNDGPLGELTWESLRLPIWPRGIGASA